MADSINWNLLQQPNLVGNFLAGQEYGQKQRRQTDRRNALSGYATDPEGAAANLIASGDELGIDIQRNNRQEAREKREDARATTKEEAEKRERALTAYSRVAKITSSVQTPEQLEELKANPMFGALYETLAPDLGINLPLETITFDQLQKFNQVGAQLNAKEEDAYTLGPNDRRYRGRTLIAEGAPRAPEPKQFGDYLYIPSGGQSPTARPAPTAPPGAGFDAHIGPLLQREGGFVARDGRSGAPANFGINQKHNPDVDVSKLTREQAAQLYRERYWNPINGDQLPPEAQGPVFDAAVNQGPQTALRLWDEAGGDVRKFNDLRLARYRQTPGYEESGQSWERRVGESSGVLAGGSGGDGLGGAPQIPGYEVVGRTKEPKGQERPATAEEKAQYGVAPEVPAKITADGGFQVITGTGAGMKRVPVKVQTGYVENNSSIRQIDEAIAALKSNPKAMGMMNVLGDEVRQRTDQGGISTRAGVANIGSLTIHDRSGAAVTAAETPRLKPFIPMPTDTAKAAIIKLQGLRRQLENANGEIEVQYGEESGYTPLSGGIGGGATGADQPNAPTRQKGWTKNLTPAQRATAVQNRADRKLFVPANEAEYSKLPSGTRYVHPSGQIKVKP